MRHKRLIAVATLALACCVGCGGAPPSGNKVHTAHQQLTPALQRQWVAAQQAIGTQSFDLNAAVAPPYGTAPHDWRTADPRALTLSPDGLEVVLVPDNGSGAILTPAGRSVHGYLEGDTAYIAASGAASYFEWEAENWILLHWYADSMGGR